MHGEDPGISCHAWAGLALWFLGEPDEALTRLARAVALARDPAHGYSLACALSQAACLHQHRGEPDLPGATPRRRWRSATAQASPIGAPPG